jgi:hypothetical protein
MKKIKALERLNDFKIVSSSTELYKGGCIDPTGSGIFAWACSFTSDGAIYDDNGKYYGMTYDFDASKTNSDDKNYEFLDRSLFDSRSTTNEIKNFTFEAEYNF